MVTSVLEMYMYMMLITILRIPVWLSGLLKMYMMLSSLLKMYCKFGNFPEDFTFREKR